MTLGQVASDVINEPEVTLVNRAGERHDYWWRTNLPVQLKAPVKANIEMVNLKSEYKPFYKISPTPFESAEGNYASPFFRSDAAAQASLKYWPASVPGIYGWWNQWPVTPVPGDGRWVINDVHGLRLENPVVQINGTTLAPDGDFQSGTAHELDQWKTALWLNRDFLQEAKFNVAPGRG